jgi:hypothetical protein
METHSGDGARGALLFVELSWRPSDRRAGPAGIPHGRTQQPGGERLAARSKPKALDPRDHAGGAAIPSARLYEKASDATRSVKIIICFTAGDQRRVAAILKRLKLGGDSSIVVVDARNDNKPSGSKA